MIILGSEGTLRKRNRRRTTKGWRRLHAHTLSLFSHSLNLSLSSLSYSHGQQIIMICNEPHMMIGSFISTARHTCAHASPDTLPISHSPVSVQLSWLQSVDYTVSDSLLAQRTAFHCKKTPQTSGILGRLIPTTSFACLNRTQEYSPITELNSVLKQRYRENGFVEYGVHASMYAPGIFEVRATRTPSKGPQVGG
jgi:hypothetical protein